MQKITPFFWFDKKAEEAARYYVSIFKNSSIGKMSYYDKASAEVSGMPEESIMTVEFQIEGQQFVALNGGPLFKFTEAISFMVNCITQEEIDYYWDKLTSGGEGGPCGWLKDKYGVSWQVTPVILDAMLQDRDKKRAGRVMQAMLKMKKIDIAELKRAYDRN